MKPQANSTTEVLAGLVERVTFHSQETGFCVLRVKARGHRDLVTTVGHAAMISAGEWITASGIWLNDRNHGLQFKAHFLKTSAPSTIEGIEKYLGSGMMQEEILEDFDYLTMEDIQACLSYAADRERHQLIVNA